jgi:hypothetical protein
MQTYIKGYNNILIKTVPEFIIKRLELNPKSPKFELYSYETWVSFKLNTFWIKS